MSEDAVAPAEPSAGAMLRAARERQGMHIAVLAANIKVAKPKLEALESDRYDELPDMTFTRALAQTVCRALKIDAEPVLARLPQAVSHKLDPIGGGINEPFHEKPGRMEPSDWTLVNRPFVWAVIVLLVAAGVLYLLPESWLRRVRTDLDKPVAPVPVAPVAAPASPVPAASVAAPASPVAASVVATPIAESVVATPVVVDTVQSTPVADSPAQTRSSALLLRTRDSSWIEVHDANGQVLLSRTLLAGEAVGLDGAAPLRVKIGNASATEVNFRGQPVDLSGARDKVVRLELK